MIWIFPPLCKKISTFQPMMCNISHIVIFHWRKIHQFFFPGNRGTFQNSCRERCVSVKGMATVVKLRDMVGWDLRKGKRMMFWDHMMISCVRFLFPFFFILLFSMLLISTTNSYAFKTTFQRKVFTERISPSLSWKVRNIHNLTTAGTPPPGK